MPTIMGTSIKIGLVNRTALNSDAKNPAQGEGANRMKTEDYEPALTCGARAGLNQPLSSKTH